MTKVPILSGDHRVIVNSIGEGAIWVSNYNGVLENGDYITSSAIPGIGMKQDEPYLANFTVAKITMDCDFNPNMVLLQKAKQEYVQRDDNYILDNVLDENCNIIYEQVLDTSNNPIYEPEYLVQYMRLDGTVIDRATYDVELSSNLAVYVCAFVGCTYHCG